MKIRPPRSEDELQDSARKIAGRTLGELAGERKMAVPPDQKRAKGWAGTLIEQCLGATAGSRAEPDFQRIGVELKTIPINTRGKASESTYVCTVQLTNLYDITWETCWVRKKLNRVLWVPVEANPEVPMAQRRVGSALLWSATPEQEASLSADWKELTDLIKMGHVDEITAHQGEYLQIRPKAADSKARRWGIDDEGRRVKTLPRGYYLRARFTNLLLQSNYAQSTK